jgi:hypothetical protein
MTMPGLARINRGSKLEGHIVQRGGGGCPPSSFFLFAISNAVVLTRHALPPRPLLVGPFFARVMTAAAEVSYNG